MKLYIFWTGTNPLTPNRIRCLETIKNTGLELVYIDTTTLSNYIKEPLHPGYQYLATHHKSDYLRCYFMHFYGGAYSDIKEINDSWLPALEELESNEDKWICGYPEIGDYGVPKLDDPINDIMVRKNWKKLIGNGAFICKPNTSLTIEWYSNLIKLMDSKLKELKIHPAKNIFETDENRKKSKYPLRWSEVQGMIFHPLIYKYQRHVLQTLPIFSLKDYR
jgi:hypothetical protein